MFVLAHRHLRYSNLIRIKSETKGHNILWRLYESIRSERKTLLVYLTYFFVISHRHLPHSISMWIKSDMLGWSILLRPYAKTQWAAKTLLDKYCILNCYLTQTLTTLNLDVNQIGDAGAQYLGDCLRINTVRKKDSAWHIFYSCLLSHTDTYYTQPRFESNRRRRSAISWWCHTNKHSENERISLIYLRFLFLLSHRHLLH